MRLLPQRWLLAAALCAAPAAARAQPVLPLTSGASNPQFGNTEIAARFAHDEACTVSLLREGIQAMARTVA